MLATWDTTRATIGGYDWDLNDKKAKVGNAKFLVRDGSKQIFISTLLMTIAGGGAKIPSCIRGAVDESTKIDDYATCFLRGAVKRGIQVLGVTPHSPRFGTSNDLSAVWKIVDKWNFAVDDDDVPFREKIYAIFPGFESSLKDGSSGLHMLFLFDPEIGFERYLRAFDQVMGGVSPWSEQHGNNLQISNNSSEQAFDDLSKFYQRESGGSGSNESHWGLHGSGSSYR